MSAVDKGKKKQCRIPTFGTRIPQVAPKPTSVEPESSSTEIKITGSHLGRNVRVGEKEGILKYVGTVDFAKGIWCGIELTNACGKNNGCVNGVQYFTCEELRGLMTPVAKVTLIEGTAEVSDGDNVSGPYSILCLPSDSGALKLPLKLTATDNNCENSTFGLNKENQNCTYKKDCTLQQKDCTYDAANITRNEKPFKFSRRGTYDVFSADSLRRQVLTDKTQIYGSASSVESLLDGSQKVYNETYNLKYNRAFSIENLSGSHASTFDLNNLTRDITLSAENLHHRIQLYDKKQTINGRLATTPESINSLTNNRTCTLDIKCTNSKKRTNDTFTQDQEKDGEETGNCVDDRLLQLSINKSIEDILRESTVEVKRRRTSDGKSETHIGRRSTPFSFNQNQNHSTPVHSTISEDLRSLHFNAIYNNEKLVSEESPSSSFSSLKQSEYLNPIRNDFLDDLKKLHSNDNECENSNDVEESLGILTPDQMVDCTHFSESEGKVKRRTFNLHDEFPVDELNSEGSYLRKTSIIKTDSKLLTVKKPNSLPQLLIVHQLLSKESPSRTYHIPTVLTEKNHLKQSEYLNSMSNDVLDELKKVNDNESENSKRDSLDFEESLGILTPDQMIDSTNFFESENFLDRTQQVANQAPEDLLNQDFSDQGSKQLTNSQKKIVVVETFKSKEVYEEAHSPNLNSVTDCSLGIIDPDQMLSAFLKTDTTMNFDLPLDPSESKQFNLARCEETPSPEELPLDNTPIVESEPSKQENTKSKTNSSFITSITSITSLDTGYQGDGEMSRPASRGADNSPLTRRPFPRPLPRRPDPMTDSDFYTESDADNHEDNQVKGDRRAQVIDGTLYGIDPQAAADIYVNNRENMDSSGVFTDIESSTRIDEEIGNGNGSDIETPKNKTVDVSPSDSTKTISENSQSKIHLQKTAEINETDKITKENPKKRNAPSPGISSPSSLSSPRHLKEENVSKKYKMPKKDVASKIKTMLHEPTVVTPEKKMVKKPINRWDAVMNKISKNEQNKTNLKEIKSKVFNGIITTSTKSAEVRKPTALAGANQNNKSRRIRTRTAHNSSPLKKTIGSSVYSSLSDLSASASPPKKNDGTKKREAIQVTQVLTPKKLSSKSQQSNESKKNAININNSSPSPHNDTKSKRGTLFPVKEKKLPYLPKESIKPTVKGGRTSPSSRPPVQQITRTPIKKVPPTPRATEALAVLVHHLVFNVEAYQVPHLRRQVEKYRLEAEEIRLACRGLEEALSDEKLRHQAVITEERARFREDIAELIEKHRNQISQLTSQHAEATQQLRSEKETLEQRINQKHDEQMATLRRELERLQKSHQETVDILREENDCIRDQIDEKQLEVHKANHESLKLKEDYETKEIKLKEEIEHMRLERDKVKHYIRKIEIDYQEKVKEFIEENKRLREENDRLLSYGDQEDIVKQEVQSLRVVLELKQNEITELRKSLEEARQKQQILEGAEEKAASLQARCEDLQHQLQRKNEYEQTLIQENQKLQESVKEEVHHARRLSQHNEELQWKLRQNKEVITKVMEQAEESVFNRSGTYSSSFNERHFSEKSFERALSFRESSIHFDSSSKCRKTRNSSVFDDDISPPTSPKVKGVVEKSDSVSYVLDLDESPDQVASRILRRSFRNSTPPKNTPTKSPLNKRPRTRMHPLSLSASSSSILSPNKEESERPRSASGTNGTCEYDDEVFLCGNRHSSTPKNHDGGDTRQNCSCRLDLDEDHEEDLPLPALPSEMDKRNGVLALPSPKRLAADHVASDTNSEDESTSSSQL